MNEELHALIGAELRRRVPPAVTALAQQLAARAGGGAVAVLFYGSALRDDALDGVLDFYVLVERAGDWPQSRAAAWAGRILPPNVGYVEQGAAAPGNRRLRARYAVMTLGQFRRAMSVRRIDTTVWARFSQPCACVLARDAAAFAAVGDAVCDAVVTAARWAAALGPPAADAASYWRALYQRTYAAELRVESAARAVDLVAQDAARFTRLLPLAWRAGRVDFSGDVAGEVAPVLGAAERAQAASRWRRRRRLGRLLNLLRLLKAALTFENATDYVAWKVERHSGLRIEPTAFQRRHPLLAAPALYWRLRRLGVLR